MIRLLIVSDVRLFREGLSEILSHRRVHEIAGTAATASEALHRTAELQPDMALVDSRMADSLSYVRTITRLHSPSPTKVLMLGIAELESTIIDWAEAGVAGFVPLDASVDDLMTAIDHSARGELACSARMASILLRHVGTLAVTKVPSGPTQALTSRELQVLRLLDRHMTNKEIARSLGIEVTTVKNHVHRLLEKLEVHRRLDAVTRVRERLAK